MQIIQRFLYLTNITRNLAIIDTAREYHISLPPHTSGKTQPLDVFFMKSFKTYYAVQVENCMDSHEGSILTHYSIGPLFTMAYETCIARIGILSDNAKAFHDDSKLLKNVTRQKSKTNVQLVCTDTSGIDPDSGAINIVSISIRFGWIVIVFRNIENLQGSSCFIKGHKTRSSTPSGTSI